MQDVFNILTKKPSGAFLFALIIMYIAFLAIICYNICMNTPEKCVGQYYANFPSCKATREDDLISCGGRQACQQCLGRMALTDGLTGMGNRFKRQGDFNGLVEENKQFGVIQIDIVNFGFVNNTFGHDLGDELLKATGEFIDNATRSYDMVSSNHLSRYSNEENTVGEHGSLSTRSGGDEFTTLVPLVSRMSERTVENPTTALYVMVDRLKRDYLIDPLINDYNLRDQVIVSEKPLSLRAGAAVYKPGQTLDEFLSLADPKVQTED